jgi:hypothetical protein
MTITSDLEGIKTKGPRRRGVPLMTITPDVEEKLFSNMYVSSWFSFRFTLINVLFFANYQCTGIGYCTPSLETSDQNEGIWHLPRAGCLLQLASLSSFSHLKIFRKEYSYELFDQLQ